VKVDARACVQCFDNAAVAVSSVKTQDINGVIEKSPSASVSAIMIEPHSE